jgi:hypothetical protein
LPPVSDRDPRYRRYRAAMWALYFGCIVLGVTLLVRSVSGHLRGAPRGPAGPPPTRAALRECMYDLESLFHEQNQRAWGLAADLEKPAPFEAWNVWATGFETRVRDLSDRCGLDVDDPRGEAFAERAELAAARDAVLALHRAYALHVNRFAAEQGDLVRGAAEALAHARVAVTRGR